MTFNHLGLPFEKTISINSRTRAIVRLPMPADGLALINNLIQRVYGTGEWTMAPSGEWISLNAPEDLGPRKTGRRKTPPLEEGDLVESTIEDDILSMTLEQKRDVVVALGLVLTEYFELSGGINFVELKVQHRETKLEHAITVQRLTGKSPADLLAQARQRLKDIEDTYHAGLELLDTGNAGYKDPEATLDSIWQLLSTPAEIPPSDEEETE